MVSLMKWLLINGGVHMKSTGVIRRVDELGRIVIPIEIRTQFGIAEKDPLEIYVDGSSIILKKYEQNCIFCGNTKKLENFEGKIICKKCINNISKMSNNPQT